MNDTIQIAQLTAPFADADIAALTDLLVTAVNAGAAVSFLAPLTHVDAEHWWRNALSAVKPRSIVLVARDRATIVATVQLHPAWAPNQPHRAEVVKLLVAPSHQRTGLGGRMMSALETAATQAGFRLLTLDAKEGEAAARLYRRTGWISAGTIPRYALDPNGETAHDATFFYKELRHGEQIPA